MTTLLLVGATGLVGRHVVDRALNDTRVTGVVALTRRPLAPRPRLNNPIMNFDSLDERPSWWKADAVICTLGTTMRQAGSREAFRRVDFDHVLTVAEIARARGARAFVFNSSLGADPDARSFYLRVKGDAELALERMRFPSLTIVRPSVLIGRRGEFRPAERALIGALRLLRPVVPRRYRAVPADHVASALLEAALIATPGLRVIESDQI